MAKEQNWIYPGPTEGRESGKTLELVSQSDQQQEAGEPSLIGGISNVCKAYRLELFLVFMSLFELLFSVAGHGPEQAFYGCSDH